MPKFTCSIKTTMYITKEVFEDIEIDAPDEVQAEEDAITAAGLMDKKTWLEHPESLYSEEHDFEFEVESIEEKDG